LQNGVQTIRLLVTIFATLTISTSVATNSLGTGSLAQAVRIGLVDAGTDRVRCEGKGIRFVAECFAPSAMTEVRQTAVAVAAYPLITQFPVWFSSPYAANPMEAAFLENDPNTYLQFALFQKTTTPHTFLISGGGAGTGLGSITARVIQEAQVNRTSLPYFIPTMREVTLPVVAANSIQDFPLSLKLNRLRGVLLTQDTNVGTVNDIIQGAGALNVGGLTLIGDNGQIIGPNFANIDQLAEAQEQEFGGNVYPPKDVNGLCNQQGANILFHFQKWGRLASLLDPRAYVNLRFQVNVAPSLQTGVTSSLLRATLLEMERPAPNGTRNLVAPLPNYLA
jgi:hypothetical protein